MHKTLRYLIIGLFATPLFAQEGISVKGTITQQLPQGGHTIELLHLKLSSQAKNILGKRFQQENNLKKFSLKTPSSSLPKQIQLGMNNVPVLDQGTHGTCATFASIGALDAMLERGNYISPLCLLSLNEYLSTHARTHTLWDGGFPKQIFNIISMFGIINIDNQHQFGCGGLTEYPQHELQNYPELSVDNYYQISENLAENAPYHTTNIFDIFQFINDEKSIKTIESDAKLALAHGDRLTLGIILVPDEVVGAHGSFHQKGDSWVLSQNVKNYFQTGGSIAGHALIITGYDDNAVAIDDEGKKHKGLFTVRNSWGENSGDHGDYYVSYDYFRSLIADLIRIRKLY